MKIGYACTPLTINARTDNKVFSKQFSEETFIAECKKNLENLKLILIHNVHNDLELFEISSNIIPLASDPVNTVDWQEIFKKELKEIGDFIKENDIRVSMTPGPFTTINSPNTEVIEKSIIDLNYYYNFLNSLGLDSSHKIILPIGGVYADKAISKDRFIENFQKLSMELKSRLAIRNDDKNYSFNDVLAVCDVLNAPMVFDELSNETLADNNYALSEIIENIEKTWSDNDGTAIIYYSQQSHTDKKGIHSSTMFVSKFLEFYNNIKDFNIDIMLKFSDKDISAIKCKNIMKELSGEDFDSEYLLEEFNRYKLLLAERGDEFIEKPLTLAKTSKDIIPFYRAIDEALERFIKPLSFSYALRDAAKLISNDIKNPEKNHIGKLILNNKFERCKSYMYEVALRNNSSALLSTYFFSQP